MGNFIEEDYVLVPHEDFHKGGKLCLRWRGPRRITKALNAFVYQVEYLRNNGLLTDVDATCLKFYSDALSERCRNFTSRPVIRNWNAYSPIAPIIGDYRKHVRRRVLARITPCGGHNGAALPNS